MQPEIVLMNFTHVYEAERFMSNRRFKMIPCTDLQGTDCYLDPDSERKLVERMKPFSPQGIHFIDSGNYHYLTKLWTDKIQESFSLIVFDHHPDMQPSLFEGLMSCGCWVKTMLDENPWLRKVVTVGASPQLVQQVPVEYRHRVHFAFEHLEEPVYVSVDKDVLNKASAATNWDQGTMSLAQLEELFNQILHTEKVIGVDVCGECSTSLDAFEESRELALDGTANRALLDLYLGTQL